MKAEENYEEDYYEDSAWGPPARKYVCEICVVEVPCYDTLVKHKRGKEHIKREKDLEERRKRDGLSLGDHAWAESKKPVGQFKGFQMHDNERQELNALRAEKMSLQAKVQENMKELKECNKEHLQIVRKAEECERYHDQGRVRKFSDEGFASFSETGSLTSGSSSAGSRTTVPFFPKDEKKAVKGEYWEDEDEQVKQEYGENTRQRRRGMKYGGGSLWVGEFKDEIKEVQENEVKQEVKKEKTDAPGWGSAFRNS